MKKMSKIIIIFTMIIGIISHPYKVNALEDDLVYETETHSEIVEILDYNPILKGQISKSKLKLTLTSTKAKNKDGSLSNLKVKFSYKWLTEPLMRLQDALTVKWDNNKLRYKDGSFEKKDYYINNQGNKVLYSFEKGPAKISTQAIGWFANIAGYQNTPYIGSEGYGQFTLVPKTTIKSGSVQLYGQYNHCIIGSLSISISGIGLTISGSSDSQATSTTISF